MKSNFPPENLSRSRLVIRCLLTLIRKRCIFRKEIVRIKKINHREFLNNIFLPLTTPLYNLLNDILQTRHNNNEIILIDR